MAEIDSVVNTRSDVVIINAMWFPETTEPITARTDAKTMAIAILGFKRCFLTCFMAKPNGKK
jgi:hypothetical protein